MTERKRHVLCVCSQNLQRSPTAADLISERLGDQYEAKSAGIDPLAEVQITQQHIDWADIIICMESLHRAWIDEHCERGDTPVHVLDIPDHYRRDDPLLRRLLSEQLAPILDGNHEEL